MQLLLLFIRLLTTFCPWLNATIPAGNGHASDLYTPHSCLPTQASAKPLLHFEDFRANSFYAGKPAKINYKSHSIARQYRTVITGSYKEAPKANFGGHYRFIIWGCGSSCVQSALVDLRNGLVYEGPIVPVGFDLRADSRLLLGNPPGWTLTKVYELETQYWVWNEARHKFEQRFPHP